jgi:hypothetical protein
MKPCGMLSMTCSSLGIAWRCKIAVSVAVSPLPGFATNLHFAIQCLPHFLPLFPFQNSSETVGPVNCLMPGIRLVIQRLFLRTISAELVFDKFIFAIT